MYIPISIFIVLCILSLIGIATIAVAAYGFMKVRRCDDDVVREYHELLKIRP